MSQRLGLQRFALGVPIFKARYSRHPDIDVTQLTTPQEVNPPKEEGRLMSMAYLAQPEQQQQLEWLDGGTLAILLDGKATDGQLMIGRFDVSEGEAPPYHKHTREDEVFMLIKGTALVWLDDEQTELRRRDCVLAQEHSTCLSHHVKDSGSTDDQHPGRN